MWASVFLFTDDYSFGTPRRDDAALGEGPGPVRADLRQTFALRKRDRQQPPSCSRNFGNRVLQTREARWSLGDQSNFWRQSSICSLLFRHGHDRASKR